MGRAHVITIASEKGGVGKTTLAVNLAIYLKALREELPVTIFSFDNHFSVDRMFRIGGAAPGGDVSHLFTTQPPGDLARLGEYGVHFIPSVGALDPVLLGVRGVENLAQGLAGSGLEGFIVIDTRPVLDIFTQNALFAADQVIIPVKDLPSLEPAADVYAFFDYYRLPRQRLRVLPSLIDLRIRYPGPLRNPFELLRAYAIKCGYRCFDGFISKSPKVESLNTNPQGKIYPLLIHGRGTEVHLQYASLARQVIRRAFPPDSGPASEKASPGPEEGADRTGPPSFRPPDSAG
ncbi:MAG: ParA family protein [Deltaproteobacteria bacterium]|nr:ParA family protein [Deltaproteobacteria bacterium]